MHTGEVNRKQVTYDIFGLDCSDEKKAVSANIWRYSPQPKAEQPLTDGTYRKNPKM